MGAPSSSAALPPPPPQHERLRPAALRGALLLPVHRVRQRGGGEGGPAALLAEGRLLLRVSAAGRDAGPPGLEGVAAAALPRFLRAESLDGGRSAVHVRGTRLVVSCVVGGHGAPVRGRGAWSARRSHAPFLTANAVCGTSRLNREASRIAPGAQEALGRSGGSGRDSCWRPGVLEATAQAQVAEPRLEAPRARASRSGPRTRSAGSHGAALVFVFPMCF